VNWLPCDNVPFRELNALSVPCSVACVLNQIVPWIERFNKNVPSSTISSSIMNRKQGPSVIRNGKTRLIKADHRDPGLPPATVSGTAKGTVRRKWALAKPEDPPRQS